ncbi:MAG: ATP synthase F0 subunit A [Desulfobulbaceae bacterium]|nr:MAG: ATP synthase F0 subunit A [Desulfobulbaceae bacterium]
MERPIYFLNVILEKIFGLPVPYYLPEPGNFWDSIQLLAPHVTYTLLVMLFLIAIPKLTMGGKPEMVPGPGQSFWEVVIGTIEDFMAEHMGREGARMMLPLLATLGLFILVSNLIGLIPGLFSPTKNLNITLAMALIVFVTTHLIGIKYHGVAYIKHFLGPVPVLMPLMLPIELISHLARVLSLSVRLFGNMFAKDTLAVLIFILAGAYFAPLPIMMLGVMVSFIQAGVFVMLSMLYFAMAMEDAH